MGGMNDATDDNTQDEALSFEAALRELEGIVASLERGEVSLDAAISAFERGTELKTLCQSRLEEARMKVEKIKIPDAGNPPRDAMAFDADET
tara:strand:+ start:205 stop:480 length:276 start_codon:yes stop_codon:yes gene_type:complete